MPIIMPFREESVAVSKNLPHSDRAKTGTREEIQGIIKFLQRQKKNYEQEVLIYKSNPQIVRVVKGNLFTTQKQLEYYLSLLKEYQERGLV